MRTHAEDTLHSPRTDTPLRRRRKWPRGSAGRPASKEAEAEGGGAGDVYGRKEPEGRTTAPTKGVPGENFPLCHRPIHTEIWAVN